MAGNRRQWLLGFILVFGVTLGCNPPEKKSEGDKGGTASAASPSKEPVQLLNVSYDPTRELWAELNDAFKAQFTKETGRPIEIEKSHGGSASQARAIVDGMKADVATLSLWIDTDSLRRAGLIKEHWEDTFPNKSLPWVQVSGGTYRVNRTKVELSKAERLDIDFGDDVPTFDPDELRSVPLFSRLPNDIITRMANRFKTEVVSLGNELIVEGEDRNKFFILAQGQVEVLSKGGSRQQPADRAPRRRRILW